MHGFSNGRKRKQQPRRRWHRYFGGKNRAAALRGFMAARVVLGLPIPRTTIAAAAMCCGSNVTYVRAALAVLKTEDPALQQQVLEGCCSLLATAAEVRNRSALIDAYRTASTADRIAFAKAVGADMLFDNVVVPAVA